MGKGSGVRVQGTGGHDQRVNGSTVEKEYLWERLSSRDLFFRLLFVPTP
jgi:hypothetical protein